jgi:hypothetical protein
MKVIEILANMKKVAYYPARDVNHSTTRWYVTMLFM